MASGNICQNCQRSVQAIDGLCPLCGSAIYQIPPKSKGTFFDELENTDPDLLIPKASLYSQDTDPDILMPMKWEDEEDHDRDRIDSDIPTDPRGFNQQNSSKTTKDISCSQSAIDIKTGKTSALSASKKKKGNKRSLLPWYRLLPICAYLILGGAFMLHEFITSDNAKIDRHTKEAESLTGPGWGLSASNTDLKRAAEHYLAALNLNFHLAIAYQKFDIIAQRLEERGEPLPNEMIRQRTALMRNSQMEKERARRGLWSLFPVTPQDRFSITERKANLKRNSYLFVTGFVILLGWLILSTSLRALSGRETKGPNEIEPL